MFQSLRKLDNNALRVNNMIFLDASAVMHHSYHISEDPDGIMLDDGTIINTAEFGFNNFMERYMIPLLESDAPVDIVVAHDSGTDYRSGIYPEYKKTASRERPPEQRKEQTRLMDMMKRFWASIGCTQLQVKGVEADDILAYLCEKIPGHHDLYTTDVDLLQLQGQFDNVQVLLKCEYQDTDEHKGIPHKYTSISKSLLGDTSDNYSGISGFGPAKWKHLVEEYGYDGIEELAQCVETKRYSPLKLAIKETGDKVLQMMYENRAQWEISWDLAKLHPELCWKPKRKKLTKIDWYKRVPNANNVYRILNEMGCYDLAEHENLTQWLPSEWSVEAGDIDEDFFTELAKEFEKSEVVAFDYETYPSENAMLKDPKGRDFVDPREALIAGASFCFGENLNNTIYLPVNHKDCDNVSKDVIKRIIQLAEAHSKLVIQNAFFELTVTKMNLDMWLDGVYDTAIMASYVNENLLARLKEMSKYWLNFKQITYQEVTWSDELGRQRTMDELSLSEVLKYGLDDATVTGHLFVLFRLIIQLEGTMDFFEENESFVQHNLVDSYIEGDEIDWELLSEIEKEDRDNVEQGLLRIRELLQEHCSQPNLKHAEDFVSAQKDYFKAVATEKFYKENNLNPGKELTEEIGKELIEYREQYLKDRVTEALKASVYEPLIVTETYPEFKPTVKQFSEVIEKLNFDVDKVPFESVSKVRITGWLAEVRGIDFGASGFDSNELSAQQIEFCELLGEASHLIKDRYGKEYDALSSFCQKVLNKPPKITTSGTELNLGSPKQKQALMYCMLGLPIRITGRVEKDSNRDNLGIIYGSPKTDDIAIATALAEDTVEGDWEREVLETVKSVMESRTRISLYHDPYPLWKSKSDGRIHPQVKDCGTVTRRPSATAPNILQVSKHQKGGIMRAVYLPLSKDHLIVSIDFSQQELRIMASESGDHNLISCYIGENRRDVHSMTASGIAGVPYETYLEAYNDEEHKNHERFVKIRKRPAKATNFLVAYVGTASTLSQRLIIPYNEAEAMMNAAFETYPRILPWQAEVARFAKLHGYSKTAYGNRRHAEPVLFSRDKGEVKRMERQLINSTIQGTAADILKIVLTQAWKSELWTSTGATLLAPVYDEIVASVPVINIHQYISKMVDIMEVTPPNHPVPMEADVSLGHNWQKQIELGVRPSEDAIKAAVEEAQEAKHGK